MKDLNVIMLIKQELFVGKKTNFRSLNLQKHIYELYHQLRC